MWLGRNVQKWFQNSIVVPDSAVVHPADTVVNVLRLWEWEVLQHPYYSCDLVHVTVI